MEALIEKQPLLQVLRDTGVASKDLGMVDLDPLKPPAPFMAAGDKPIMWPDATLHGSLCMLLEVLREEMNLDGRVAAERLLYDARNDQVVVMRLHGPDLPDDVPLLILDATADQLLLEEVVGPVDFQRIDVEQRAFTIQVYDRTGSNSFWDGDTAPVAELADLLNVWANLGE